MSDARPKLLLFSHLCSNGFVTGAEKLLLLFARELMLRFQCVLVVPCEGVIAAQARSMGIPVIVQNIPLCIAVYLGSPSVSDHIESLKNQPEYDRLLALLTRERPSCVFVNTSVHPLPAIAAKSLGIPVLWAMMEMIHDSPHRKMALDLVNASCDAILGISQTTIYPFAGHRGKQKAHILSPYLANEQMETGSRTENRYRLRQQFGWGEQHRVVGYVAGTIYPHKGLDYFIRSARRLKGADPRVRFLAVGNPVEEEYFRMCQSMVAQSGMTDLFGWISFEEHIENFYPALDILVVPSLQAEGFGMTALEGMWFGKPVVAFASGGLAEILAETDNERFMARTGDVAELTARVKMLLDDEALRLFTGQRNEQAAHSVFGVDRFRKQLDQLLARFPIPLHFPSPLIRGSGKTVYLVENGLRRPFVSKKAMLQRGFRSEDVRQVANKEVRHIPRGSRMREWTKPAIANRTSSRSKRRRHRSRFRKRRGAPAVTRLMKSRPVRRRMQRTRTIRHKLQKRR